MTEREEEDFDRKPDQVDVANDLAMRANGYAVRQIQSQAKQKRLPNRKGVFDDIWCEDCGDEIALERMLVAFNNHLCIYCATKRERNNQLKGTT